MNVEQAMKLLGVTYEDDMASVKRKYRKKMMRFHPDSVGIERMDQEKKVQPCADKEKMQEMAILLNEAYELLKKQDKREKKRPTVKPKKWHAPINEKAYCDRNIYGPYHMDVEDAELYQQLDRGKYMWDPKEERFVDFTRSIHHAVKSLFLDIEERYEQESALSSYEKAQLSAKVFEALCMQFIHPYEVMAALSKAVKQDAEGRSVYGFIAFLKADTRQEEYKALKQLQVGDLVYPVSLSQYKIQVCNDKREDLGELALSDQALYFCVIPLLNQKAVKIKMQVLQVEHRTRPNRTKVKIRLLVRVEKNLQWELQEQTGIINQVLLEYASSCK